MAGNSVIIDAKRPDRESSFAPDATEAGKFRLKVDAAAALLGSGLPAGNVAAEQGGALQTLAQAMLLSVVELRLHTLILTQAFGLDLDLDATRDALAVDIVN